MEELLSLWFLHMKLSPIESPELGPELSLLYAKEGVDYNCE
jgi:hypothetical protein